MINMKEFRNTKIRQAMIKELEKSPHPLSARDVIKRVNAHKTSIYRQFSLLKENKVVREVILKGARHYEIFPKDHRHHFVCRKCGRVEVVIMKEGFCVTDKIKNIKGNKIMEHFLEFYGNCSKCL